MPGMVLGTEGTAGSRDTKVSIFTVLPSQSCGWITKKADLCSVYSVSESREFHPI